MNISPTEAEEALNSDPNNDEKNPPVNFQQRCV